MLICKRHYLIMKSSLSLLSKSQMLLHLRLNLLKMILDNFTIKV